MKVKISQSFLYYFVKKCRLYRKKCKKKNYGSGSAIPRIVLKDFRRMPVQYPDIKHRKLLYLYCSVLTKNSSESKDKQEFNFHPCNERIAAVAA